MSASDIRKTLKNGNFVTKGHEVKTVCKRCGKHFWVDIGIVAEEMAKYGKCKCSICQTRTLVAIRKDTEKPQLAHRG